MSHAKPVSKGDRLQLEILLSNLVDNALRYTPQEGVVDVRVDVIDGAPTLRVIDNGRACRSPSGCACSPLLPQPARVLGLSRSAAAWPGDRERRIADRHGAVVSLHAGRNGAGLEARVVFPAVNDRSARGSPQWSAARTWV